MTLEYRLAQRFKEPLASAPSPLSLPTSLLLLLGGSFLLGCPGSPVLLPKLFPFAHSAVPPTPVVASAHS